MSLDDKFFPEDGTLLTRFDNAMIKSCGKVGEWYQGLAGKPYTELMHGAYGAAAMSGVAAAVNGAYIIGPMMAVVYGIYALWPPKPMSPLEEEIRYETRGLPRKFGKVSRVFESGLALVNGGAALAAYTVNKDTEAGPPYHAIAAGASLALGWAAAAFAEYLRHANIPKPPKKTVFKRAAEWLKEHLPLPSPAPQGAYAPVRNSFLG